MSGSNAIAEVGVESSRRVHLPAVRPVPWRPLEVGALLPRGRAARGRFANPPLAEGPAPPASRADKGHHRLRRLLAPPSSVVRCQALERASPVVHPPTPPSRQPGPCAPRTAGQGHPALLAARRSARREAHRRAAGLPSRPATFPRLPRHVQRAYPHDSEGGRVRSA